MADLIAQLRSHPPFDELDAPALDFLAGRLQLAYYARGQPLVGPDDGVPGRLFIVKQGEIRGSGGPADAVLGPGECFPLGALIGRRPTVLTYRAGKDTFCWELEAARFYELLERSPRFREFSTERLAMLVQRSHRAARAEAAASSLDSANMLAPLKSVLRRAPVTCQAESTLAEATRRMHAERVGSIVIVDANGAAAGIFTTVDLLATAASGTPLDSQISRHMTAHPFALEEDATLADAALAMARNGFRHVVVTRGGRVAGIVSERDLFSLQRVGMRRTLEKIGTASEVSQLAAAASDIRQLAGHLLAQGVDAGPLTGIVSALNDALTRRIIELARERRRLEGAWCWLALGSEGRMEQTLVTDQDNALIITEGKDDFLAFADQVNRDLESCGFPLCKGDIMARNPRWCLTLAEWERVFAGWIANNDPQALLNASIFFDFRALAGEARLAGRLRATVLGRASADRAFCRALAEVALQTRPPLGLLADFSSSELDLKALGVRPFVDAARVLALAAASEETGTAARLLAAHEKTAVDAFHYLQTLRLRNGGNQLRPAELNEIDRTLLKAAFRQAVLLQQRVRLDFGL